MPPSSAGLKKIAVSLPKNQRSLLYWNEVVQMARLSSLKHEHRLGQLSDNDYRQEKSRISAGVLATLGELERG